MSVVIDYVVYLFSLTGVLSCEVMGPNSSLHTVIEPSRNGQVIVAFTPEQEGKSVY